MSDEAEIDTRMVVAEDKQMDKKGGELGENGSLTGQMTVIMTDKDPTWSTPCKGESKEVNLSELGSSLTGSFQSLKSSQSSEGGNGTSMIPLVGGIRVLKFEDTLSKEVRLKHLIINADAFRGKVRMGHYPQIGGKGKKSNQRMGKQPGGTKVVKDRRCNSRKGSKSTRTQGNNLRSCSAIDNQKDFDLVCWI